MSTKKSSSLSHFLIVTPSYNQADFIDQTIESVLTQPESKTYWVMDGGSTDETVKVLKKYGSTLNWISKKDEGQTDAINKGLSQLKKDKLKLDPHNTFFAYINSDDYYLPDAFTGVTEAFAKNPIANWVVGDCQIIDHQNQLIHQPIARYKKFFRQHYFPSLLKILNPIPQPAVFVRWTAIQKVGLFNSTLRYVMDYEYWLRLQEEFGPPIMLPKKLAAFRVHGQSKGGSQFLKQFDEELVIAKRFTKNPLCLFLHQMHNEVIKFVYRVIK